MKIIKVSSCKECLLSEIINRFSKNSGIYFCSSTGTFPNSKKIGTFKRISNNKAKIPDWCPLEDYEVVNS